MATITETPKPVEVINYHRPPSQVLRPFHDEIKTPLYYLFDQGLCQNRLLTTKFRLLESKIYPVTIVGENSYKLGIVKKDFQSSAYDINRDSRSYTRIITSLTKNRRDQNLLDYRYWGSGKFKLQYDTGIFNKNYNVFAFISGKSHALDEWNYGIGGTYFYKNLRMANRLTLDSSRNVYYEGRVVNSYKNWLLSLNAGVRLNNFQIFRSNFLLSYTESNIGLYLTHHSRPNTESILGRLAFSVLYRPSSKLELGSMLKCKMGNAKYLFALKYWPNDRFNIRVKSDDRLKMTSLLTYVHNEHLTLRLGTQFRVKQKRRRLIHMRNLLQLYPVGFGVEVSV
eukprot:TRINITY_DN8270_c0_g1_i3.p1 TRINITY_DN8270_c0_g1~~TRINITY_DN8270_c0_g1_i3.p1  ORF type:complete len:339 (-),score=53.59 TRINITY_DN8270_c0_g1_i3:155-1171(-)